MPEAESLYNIGVLGEPLLVIIDDMHSFVPRLSQ